MTDSTTAKIETLKGLAHISVMIQGEIRELEHDIMDDMMKEGAKLITAHKEIARIHNQIINQNRV